MKNTVTRTLFSTLILCVSLLSPMASIGEQFVDLSVELEINTWDYWLKEDRDSNEGMPDSRGKSIFPELFTFQCVIGTNSWMMDGGFVANGNVRYTFKGTNIVADTIITRGIRNATAERLKKNSSLTMSLPKVGSQRQRILPTLDGNPGRPVRVLDLMELRGRIGWLALCSGSALQREERQLFPPSDFWKHYIAAPNGFVDNTTVFDDGLGLPRSIELLDAEQRPIFQYQVRHATNVADWTIPTEFYGMQYLPTRSGDLQLHQTFKGAVKVNGIREKLSFAAHPDSPTNAAQATSERTKSLIHLGRGATPPNAFDLYKLTTGLELEFSPSITNVAAFIQIASTEGNREELAELLERTLKEQAGLVITRTDGNKALVTYDSELPRTNIEYEGLKPPRLRANGTVPGRSGRGRVPGPSSTP